MAVGIRASGIIPSRSIAASSTASSSCTRRTNRFSPLREYTSACVPVSAGSAAPKSKTRMPFAGLAETAFASNRAASAAKVTAAADELESKRPSKYHMSGVGLRKTPISSPLHWTTRSALTSPTREFYELAPYGRFLPMAPLHIAAAPRNVTLHARRPRRALALHRRSQRALALGAIKGERRRGSLLTKWPVAGGLDTEPHCGYIKRA